MRINKKMILVTGFEPFGIVGTITKKNPSKEVAEKLSNEFKTDLLILPVKNICLDLLEKKVSSKKYNFIFMLGQADYMRIETVTRDRAVSIFAKKIREKIGIMNKENIGDYYCNKVYKKALGINDRSIFIHIPRRYNYSKIRDVFLECLKW